jgi:hypothetical protein
MKLNMVSELGYPSTLQLVLFFSPPLTSGRRFLSFTGCSMPNPIGPASSRAVVRSYLLATGRHRLPPSSTDSVTLCPDPATLPRPRPSSAAVRLHLQTLATSHCPPAPDSHPHGQGRPPG